eukprot:CAMPEP_0113623370 /NCGR_PEP_ID=MMETSP0017_2-20120614/12018_1 /TAXON_ID=2856 /ORGANISM="Cylindrotheca closterium" /LENGTH=124 /DNA_ID=CAMNT_0000533309 /DNA_START=16 /DNA_END=390 /DNA_ORIENTATION=- /assembly_acc=CAM_ASM_000147
MTKNMMYYSTSSFDFEEKKCASCTSDLASDILKDDDEEETGLFAPVDLAIELMLSGNPCTAMLPSSVSVTTSNNKVAVNQILKASSSKLVRPPRQSLPQDSMFDSSSVGTSGSGLTEDMSVAGL